MHWEEGTKDTDIQAEFLLLPSPHLRPEMGTLGHMDWGHICPIRICDWRLENIYAC